jgi:Abnormal spindle-like microcephaly-assoc'd, ASPM-SPD-2-Hydin
VRSRIALLAVLLAVAGGQDAFGGTPGPLSASPDPIDFQTIAAGDSPTKQVTIRNDGPSPVIIVDVGTSNGGGDLSASGCGPLPTTLLPTEACQVNVTYSPASGGSVPADASLDITDDDLVNPVQHFIIQGSAKANRFQFTARPGSASFGTVAIGDSAGPKQFTVHNETDFAADPNAHMIGSDPSDFNVSGCGSSVSGGGDCTASVTFSPSRIGPESATLQADGDSFSLSGTGAEQVAVQPTDVAFGNQHVGTNSPPQPVTVTNNRDQPISVTFSSGNPVEYTVNPSDCGGQLAAGQSCSLQVTFSPNAIGTQAGTLTVVGHDVSLTGTGTAGLAEVTPGSISFGNQPVATQSATQTVTVTNGGNESMQVASPTLGGTNPGEFTISDDCLAMSPLAPDAECTISVTFAPTAAQQADATLQVDSNATNGQQAVQLHGTGTPSAVSFTPAPITFKRPHHAGTFSRPRTIVLTNQTSGPITIRGVRLAGVNPHSFRIAGGSCGGATLSADATCTETVRFAPNEVGAKSAFLSVADDGPHSPHVVALNGRSTYPRDDVAVHGAVGCDATKITWRRGGSSRRFDRTVVVRSRTHVPAGPNDGTRLPHGAGVLHDVDLRHFTAYEYRVFALYRSHTRPGTFNHSRGVILRLRTGEICTPMDGGVISDATPTASWLRHATLFGYSFRLFHAGEEVQQPRFVHATSFTFSGRRRLRHGFTYTLFLYAYPPAHPEGTSIGRTTFRVR